MEGWKDRLARMHAGPGAAAEAGPGHARCAPDQVQIDPGFVAFVARAEQLGVPLRIVSDGTDYAIHRILANHGLSRLPVVANHLRWCGDHWELESPYQAEGCRSGTCKCTCAAQARANEAPRVLMIGDGSSDFCVSEDADFVFAKRRLITHCANAASGMPPSLPSTMQSRCCRACSMAACCSHAASTPARSPPHCPCCWPPPEHAPATSFERPSRNRTA